MSDEPAAARGAETGDPSPATASVGDPSQRPPFTHTRASGYWAAVVVGLLVLLVLIVFILENGQRASVSFLGVHGHLPEGVVLLLAAVIGGLFVVLAGAARILQLRSRARGQRKKEPRRRRSPRRTEGSHPVAKRSKSTAK
jgi:uncharacterized integral membrane protein